MKRILFIIAIFLTIFAFSEDSPDESVVRKIDNIVQGEKQYDLFSGTVLIAHNGHILYAKGIGEACKDYQIPNRIETRFNIGSIQKCFIATVIMQLYQEGKISLTDPLSKYFPDCPYNSSNQIQIRHLLNHTSGLGNYRKHKDYPSQSENFRTIEDVLPIVYQDRPVSEPGEKFRYSNTGMLFLKSIIQKVTCKKFEQVLEERIFSPLGMDQTVLFIGGDILPNRATGHTFSEDGQSYRRVLEEPSAYAGGGIYTTVLDLLKFDQALYGEQLLNEGNKKIMFTPVEPSKYYAYGWIVVPFGGTKVIYHGGSSGGFNAEFRRYPEKKYSIFVLSNYEEAAFELANKIDSMLLGMPYAIATEVENYYRRGRSLHRRKKDLEISYQLLLKALALKPVEAGTGRIWKSIEREINAIGFGYLGKKAYQKAIDIFKTNARHFPDSFNVFESLGDAYEKKGQRKLAIRHYQKALKVNPMQTDREKKRYNDIEKKLKKLTNNK
jgi:CubicO group peptidase (beta-lactamase class C family)